MTLHLIKLCVGIVSITHLRERQAIRMDAEEAEGRPRELRHRTRQMPRRGDQLLDGGSLYWVIKGVVQVRQPLADLRPVRGDDGVPRCDIVLEPTLIPTRPQPRRAFQGWRYLQPDDAPADLKFSGTDAEKLPPEMRAELIELGLL
ncbi:MAG: DUF1489 family protein [Methyloligellaceae bacterium]